MTKKKFKLDWERIQVRLHAEITELKGYLLNIQLAAENKKEYTRDRLIQFIIQIREAI